MFNRYYRIITASLFGISLLTVPAYANGATPLYGVFEIQVTNTNAYTNKFDYSEIELQATFTAPSAAPTDFFGYHAGDGSGGQTGNIWTLRFRPDQVGTWTYTYSWAGTGTKPAGGGGTFTVTDTGLPGPLKIATDNTWYFMDARGNKFDARPLGTMDIDRAWNNDTGAVWGDPIYPKFITEIDDEIIANNYNMMYIFLGRAAKLSWGGNYWFANTVDLFDIEVWDDLDEVLQYANNNGVYTFFMSALIHGANLSYLTTNLQKYWTARFAPYYTVMGYSPVWEWSLFYSVSELTDIMESLQTLNPFPTLMTIHDNSDSSFTTWLDFSTKQHQVGYNCSNQGGKWSDALFNGNCPRTVAIRGGVAAPFADYPIFGAEDIWECPSGIYNQPRNATEVRRGAWGEMMAGVIPVYSQWLGSCLPSGSRVGGAEVVRMFDFFYTKTDYRNYVDKNSLVSAAARQISSGKTNVEYLVYDDNGGSITIDLSEATDTFDVLWYDPTTGAQQTGVTVNGGASRTLTSPYSGDSVLLLTGAAPPDTLEPKAPTNLTIN